MRSDIKKGIEGVLKRVLMYGMGFIKEEIERLLIGIVNV